MTSRLIQDVLRVNLINEALAAVDRDSVLREMVCLAERSGLVLDSPKLLRSVIAREAQGTTALSEGVAMLHPKSTETGGFKSTFLVLGRTPQKVVFDAQDGVSADLFFLTCSEDPKVQAMLIVRLFQMVQNTQVLAQLRQAPDATAMFKCLITSEQHVLV